MVGREGGRIRVGLTLADWKGREGRVSLLNVEVEVQVWVLRQETSLWIY